MNRLGALCGLVIGIVLVQACGGGGTSTPTPAGTEAEDAADNVAKAGPIVKIAIRMSKNDGQYENDGIDAPCVGASEIPRPRAQQKQRIRWHVRQAEFNPCPGLEQDEVEVRFENAVLSLDANGGGTAVKDAKAMGGQINVRAHDDAEETKHKYYIYYQNMKASPDPELDILGDCGPSCGPL